MAERRCLNCDDPLPPERTRRAKFCGRDCQVEHLREHGPTEAPPDPTAIPKAVTIHLDHEVGALLRHLAVEAVVSPRLMAEQILVAGIRSLYDALTSAGAGRGED